MKNLLSRELRIVNRQWSMITHSTLNTQQKNKKTSLLHSEKASHIC